VNEKVFKFGPDGVLSGVLTEPEKGRQLRGAPAVLMWNVGLNHHVGPWRFNVDLARDLATRGVTAFRFDVSGLGDSEARRDTSSDHVRALADVRDAMTFVTKKTGAESFVLVGFCSSVDAAHVIGREDRRVAGVVYLEGYAFRTRGFWNRYALRVLDVWRIKRALKAKIPEVFGRELVGTGFSDRRPTVFAREYPTTEQLRVDFARMVQDRKKLLLIYVGGDTNYNHSDQFFEMYADESLRGRIDVDYYGDMDHTFFRVRDRLRVLDRVSNWIAEVRDPIGSSAVDQARQPV
jgi:Alpha/beta hydrolase family